MQIDGLLAEIDIKIFFEAVGATTLEQIVEKNLNSHEKKYMKKNDDVDKKDYSHLDLGSLISIKKLGAG